jgi:hypothetical protein
MRIAPRRTTRGVSADPRVQWLVEALSEKFDMRRVLMAGAEKLAKEGMLIRTPSNLRVKADDLVEAAA